MLPVQKQAAKYRTLEEIRQRKDELLDLMQADNKQFTAKWNKLFFTREEAGKGEFIANLVSKSVTAIDLFLLFRKIRKNYGGLIGLFGKDKKR